MVYKYKVNNNNLKCSKCGENLAKNGTRTTRAGKWQLYTCKNGHRHNKTLNQINGDT